MFGSKVILSTAAIVFTTWAFAADGRLPSIDLDKRCHKSAKTVQEMLGGDSSESKAFDSCMRSETEAQKALLAAWKDIPASYKGTCIKPKDYSPSYVEWIACVEMLMDVKRLRSKK
jgi:hypothetical protein